MSTLAIVAAHLRDLEYAPAVVEDSRIDLIWYGTRVTFAAHVYCSENPGLLRFSTALATVPEQRGAEVLKLANLLNGRDRAWSRFYINPDSQRLLFALDTILAGEPSREHVRLGVEGLWPVNWYYPAFARVLWAGWDAARAYRCADTLDGDPRDTLVPLVV